MIRRTLIRALDYLAYHLDKWETAARVKRLQAAKTPEERAAITGCSDPGCPLCNPPALVVVRSAITLWPTPDRPITKEQWEIQKAREEIDSITGRDEAVNYPKGS